MTREEGDPMKRGTKIVAGTVVVVLAGGFFYTRYHNGAAASPAALRTVSVQNGLVQQSATGAGTVTAPTDLLLNFQNSGLLTTLNVSLGQTVTVGQVLAAEDPTTANNQLAQAKANLVAAQAKLQQLQQGLTAAQKTQDQAAVTQAQTGVGQAQTSLADAQASIAQDASNLQAAVTQAQSSLAAAQATQSQDATSSTAAVAAAQAQLAADQAAPNPNSTVIAKDQADVATAQAAQQSGATKDAASVQQAQNAVTTALNGQSTGSVKDTQSLHTAENAVTNAQNALASTIAANAVKEAPPLPGDLATAQAAVQTAQSAVAQAQTTASETTLVSPVAGVVAAISTQPGELVSGGGTSATSSSSSSTSTSSSTSKGFIEITGVNNLQVTAGFAETDAVNLKVNQPATISFNALPSVSLAGHVVSVNTQPTVVSNVVTYNATIAFDQTSPLVKDGMSANVSVVVNQVTAPYVPSLAIRSVGGNSTVTTLVNGQQAPVPISVGLQGDTNTQILGGVATGTTVVLPSLTTPTTTNSTSRTGTGGIGGGTGGAGLRLGG
jgi:multidrug efflux pump subunit AcrA (membrane-fusion protein)